MTDLGSVAGIADLAARALALGGAGLAGAVALTHWAVRHRHLAPFGGVSSMVRSLSDPLLRPIEKRLARGGMNPQDGTLWLVGIAVVAGLALVTVVRWAFTLLFAAQSLAHASPSVWAATAISAAFGILMAAILVRFVAGWLGISPLSRGLRFLAAMTDWLIVPIRRRLPPLGIVDASPMAAYLLLFILRELVLGVVVRR